MDRPPTNRTKRSESLRKLTLERLAPSPSADRSQLPLKEVIDEALKHLIDIIEMLLLEENSNNYISFMNKMEEMNEEMNKKMTLMLDDRLLLFKQEIIEMVPSYTPTPTKPRPNTQSHSSHIKTERKNITQSILAVQRSGSFNSMKSDDPIKTATHMRSEDDFRESREECNQKTLVNSSEMHSINVRISQFEVSHSKTLRVMEQRMEHRLDQVCLEVRELTESQSTMKGQLEQKLNINIEALWNVVTDLKSDQFDGKQT